MYREKPLISKCGIIAAMLVAMTSHAEPISPINFCSIQGFILGIQGGYADTHWDNVRDIENNHNITDFFPTISSSSSKNTGFAARGYLGFDFTLFFGIEAGYTYLPKASNTTFFADGTIVSDDIKNYAVDFLGKLMFPVVDGFSLYAKAGGNYFHSKLEQPDQTDRDVGHIGPAFAVGGAYEVLPNLALDLSWMRYYSGDDDIVNADGSMNNDYQPNPDMFFLGISYKFPIHNDGY